VLDLEGRHMVATYFRLVAMAHLSFFACSQQLTQYFLHRYHSEMGHLLRAGQGDPRGDYQSVDEAQLVATIPNRGDTDIIRDNGVCGIATSSMLQIILCTLQWARWHSFEQTK
jgi:hypothetical protein